MSKIRIIYAIIFIIIALFIISRFASNLSILIDILIITVSLLSVTHLKDTKFVRTTNLFQKLKYLFITYIILFLAVALFSLVDLLFFYPSEIFSRFTKPINIFYENNYLVFAYFIISCIFSIISILLFLEIYKLILVKSGRFIRRIFILFCFSIVLFLISGGRNFETLFREYENNPFIINSIFENNKIILSIIITLSLILSFKSSWVNFINKKEKIVSFFCGIVIIGLWSGIQVNLNRFIFGLISPYVVLFFQTVSIFLLIYVSMSIVSILLHMPTAGLVDKKVKQFSSFGRLSEAISTLEFGQITDLVVKLTCEVLDGKKSWLLLCDEQNDKFFLAASFNLKDNDYELVDMNREYVLNRKIIETKDTVIINEISSEKNLNLRRKIKGSLIGVPILSDNKVEGIIYAGKEEPYGFDWEDSDMLKSLANYTLIALKNTNLIKESLEKERLKQELKVAREVQLSLLPEKIPSLSETVLLDAVSIPANEVGGDYYDFIRIDDKRAGVIIGDVSGKGVSAAFYMAEIKGIIQSIISITKSPIDLLKKVNRILYDNIDRKYFITLIFGIFDFEQRIFHFARAGHTPVLYFNFNMKKGTYLQPEGLGLGLDKGDIFDKITTEEKLKFKKNDIIVLYTDGITEVLNRDGEEFGESRLLDVVESNFNLNPNELISKLLAIQEDFSEDTKRFDDVTLLMFKFV